MVDSNIIKSQYIAMQPEGPLGSIKAGSDEDLMYDGLAEDTMTVYDWLISTGDIRNPYKTPILEDLEWEYGIRANKTLFVEERRRNLAALVYAKKSNGDLDGMQDALVKRGFTTAQVFDNNPVTDTETVSMTNGEYVVNGVIYKQYVGYQYRAMPSDNVQQICCSVDTHRSAGALKDVKTEYTYLPQGNFAKIFFVGASVIRDGVTDKITHVTPIQVPIRLRTSFLESILRYKPLDTWAMISVEWIADEAIILKDTFGASTVVKDTYGDSTVIKDEVS